LYLFGFKGNLFAGRDYQVTLLSRTAPLFGILRFTPTMGTNRFLHGGTMHDDGSFIMGRGWIVPTGRNGIDLIASVKVFFVTIFGIVMRKYRRIPRAVKLSRAAVKTLGGFVQENVAAGQNDFMRICINIQKKNIM
jgi:hypothetical protein